jgi:hypothetical protein
VTPPSPVIEAKALPRLADFEGRALVHAFDPDPGDLAFGTSPFGLIEAELWPYGAVRTESGRWFAYFRTINGPVTTGLVVMGQPDGARSPLVFQDGSTASYHGPLTRTTDGDADLIAAAEGPAERPFVLRAGPELRWHEEGVLDLAGPIAGPGLQMFNSWREPDGTHAQLFHVHLGYEVHGTVLGERASGYLGLARAFLPYGVGWQTGDRFGPAPGFCSMWTAFLNVYADGTAERGMMAFGGAGNRFRFATVVGRDGLHIATDLVEVDYEISPEAYVASIDWRVGPAGDRWRFVSEPADRLDFAPDVEVDVAAEPSGYRVSLGTMQRVDDDRTPVVQIAWVEGFPEAWNRRG